MRARHLDPGHVADLRCGPAGNGQSTRANETGVSFTFDGWKGTVKLKNNCPPLLQTWSVPLKCKLSNDVGFLSGLLPPFPFHLLLFQVSSSTLSC